MTFQLKARKSLKINETEINRLPDKEFKVLVKKNY